MKITSVAELQAPYESLKSSVAIREGVHETIDGFRKHILICGGTGCTSSGSTSLREKLEEELAAHNLDREVKVVTTGCFGLCALGPIMIVYPDGTFYSRVTPDDIPEIVETHLVGGTPVARFEYHEKSGDHHVVNSLNEMTFYKKQHRVALHNCGVIDPENINGPDLDVPRGRCADHAGFRSARTRRCGLPDRLEVEVCNGVHRQEVRLLQR